MVLAKSKNAVGLGNSLMNDRFGKGKGSDMRRGNAQGIKRTGEGGETYITNHKKDAAYMKMRSVTEQAALDEFLSTAELAGTDFTAEKMNNVKIIHKDQKNPYLLSAAEERATVKKHQKNKKRLTVPRRPPWDKNTTRQELDQHEKQSLLEWRRGIAEMVETDDLLLTPFERNLEVWRQLWRVIERSDLVVQIVDARNPLLFRCEDLERYVKEVDKKKRNLLLVNKADMMTLEQRQAWASYFADAGINFRFFSAELAKEINEARGLVPAHDDSDVDDVDEQEDVEVEDDDEDNDEDEEEGGIDVEIEDELQGKQHALAEKAKKIETQDHEEEEEQWVDEESVAGDGDANDEEEESDQAALSLDEQVRILTTDDLEALFLEHSPKVINDDEDTPPRKTQIGLVGYPNVGKSSTINALLGAKKVSVSATPGKTKHFQTIHLSSRVVLCDCPGLVFPNFATTKAELVLSGVLPIDQLREHTGPATLVAQRIPQAFLEAIYGMRIETRPTEEGGTGVPTGEEVLRAYATARGFQTQGLGQPDESRAARYVLKDYVKGKLLFGMPPPADPPIDARHFNRDLYDAEHLPQRRRAALAVHAQAAITGAPDHDDVSLMDDPDMLPLPMVQGPKTQAMDKRFFAPGQGQGNMALPFHAKYTESGQAQSRHLSGRKARTMAALEKDLDPDEAKLAAAGSKKHFKANKKAAKKVRSEYD